MRNLLKGIPYSMLTFFLSTSPIEAQEKKLPPDSLRAPIELEEMSVEAKKYSELGLPEGVADLLSGEDPNQKTYNISPEVDAAVPGLPGAVIYKRLLLGTKYYRRGVLFAGRSTLNWGLTSILQGLIVEQEDDHPNAITQSQDMTLEVITQTPEGIQLEAELFKMAGGFGYSGKFLRGAVAVRHQGVPDLFPLPEGYRQEVEPLGSGWSDHLYIEFGEAKPNRSPRFSFEMQGNSLNANFVNSTDYDLRRFDAEDYQRMFIVHGEVPIHASSTVETTISHQFNENKLEIQELNEENPEKNDQRISVSTMGVNLRHSFNNNGSPFEIGIGANHIKVDKKDLWDEGKPYSINQFHGELSGLLGSRFRGRTNGRLDDIKGVAGLQYSLFGELELQITNNMSISGRGGRLRDRLLSDALEDLLGEYESSAEGDIQKHNYLELAARARTLNHEFGLTLTHLRQNRPIYGNVEIGGVATRASYQYASPNVSLTVALSYRDLEMTRIDSTGAASKGPPPGTPSLEGKIMLGWHHERYSTGISGAVSNGSVLPVNDGDIFIGPKLYLNPWITAGTGRFKIRGTLFNALGLLPNFENTLVVFGEVENRNRIRAPSFGYVSIHATY